MTLSPQSRFTALVLAGSRTAPIAGRPATYKASLPVRGVPMIRRVIDNLRASSFIADVHVCGPEQLSQWTLKPVYPVRASPAESVAAFLNETNHPWPVLVTTADHPLLSVDMIDHFCRQTLTDPADITVGMASKSEVMAAYPGSRRTSYRFRDESWCSCNIFGMNSLRIIDVVRFWQTLERNRKHPLKIVRAFGLKNLTNVLLGRWTLDQAFAAGATRLGVTARPIVMPWPEASIDIDTLDDLLLVDSILARREQPELRAAE